MEYYIVYNSANKIVLAPNITNIVDFFNSLSISTALKNNIIQRINLKSNFELNLSELQQLKPAIIQSINILLSHPDFDPFKEKLRMRYPNQFNNFPFIWNNTTYYLYPKSNKIDSEILKYNKILDVINEYINENKILKYIYKN
ncbi:hypothetical protein [Chryseobacterium bernardetii]|uniref:hypothetical protein n=1 Tax=Chryseobacterium bernardetii TaxID=1241978 RepID=UPI003019C06B